jgi:hypothetical protein
MKGKDSKSYASAALLLVAVLISVQSLWPQGKADGASSTKNETCTAVAFTKPVDQNGFDFHRDDIRYYVTRLDEARKISALCEKADMNSTADGVQAMCDAAKSALACVGN